MENNLVPFEFNRSTVRILFDGNHDPLWVANDVCEILGLHPTQTRKLDNDEKGLRVLQTLGGPQEMLVINESGLYNLIFRSNKPQAKTFRKWVTSKILPEIRKTGKYVRTISDNEEWAPIEGFGGRYLISSYGRCIETFFITKAAIGSRKGSKYEDRIIRGIIKKNIIREKPVSKMEKKTKNGKGIIHNHRLQLTNIQTGKKQSYSLRKLVADTFLPNPLNRKRVNFIDGNALNIKASNLEWCSGGSEIRTKAEYIERLKSSDVGERKNKDSLDSIIAYLQGDASQIEKLLSENRGKIFWAVQKKVHNTTEAEDLTQEILLKIYQKINDLMFHNPKNPVGWFIRVAQNYARNYLTKKRLELESYSEVGMYVKYKDNGEEYDVSEKVIYNDWLESERLAIQ